MLVYFIQNLFDGKIYVGKTCNTLQGRVSDHVGAARRGADRHLTRAIRKYGIDSFHVGVLVDGIADLNQLNSFEIFLIKLFGSNDNSIGYNMTAGGDGIVDPCEEIRKKLAMVQLGRRWHHGDDAKQKIRIAMESRVVSEETRRKLSARLIGNTRSLGKKFPPRSQEHTDRQRLAQRGKPSCRLGVKLTDETKNKIRMARLGKKMPARSEEHAERLFMASMLRQIAIAEKRECPYEPEQYIGESAYVKFIEHSEDEVK